MTSSIECILQNNEATELTVEVLERDYQEVFKEHPGTTKLEYVGDRVFDFTTYDGGVSEKWAKTMVEVIEVILSRKSFEYIESPDNYEKYLTMCNMPFLASMLDWGTSIRGAWIQPDKKYQVEQILTFAKS